ncbi:hypothetical protein ABXT44_01640 [Candidatus Pseudothioglobus sp. Uisw_041]|jgi:hypothetical protein|uniref:hypothetical protein n=1 Tax=Candidatus Pseudothioglobus sp. Uisw_041 TaxID=3230996 RepID=UPI003A89AA98
MNSKLTLSRLLKSTNLFWLSIIVIVVLKFLLFTYLIVFFPDAHLGGGSDADYYHRYAINFGSFEVSDGSSFWPVLLRFFSDSGLYNRDIFSLILFVMSITLLPYLFYKLVKVQANIIKPVRAGSFLLIIFYPTLFYYSLDVYREVFMFGVLLLSLLVYKKSLEVNLLRSTIYFLIFLGLTFFLYMLRPYLGAALGVTPFVYLIFSKTKKYIKSWIFLYFGILVLAKVTGVIDPILDYRAGFQSGGSTLGIGLLDKNPIMFLVYYLYSLFGQLFGLFLVNIIAVLVFLLESVPFIIAFIYLLKNIRFMTRFSSFLLIFFIIYTTVWVLGNDNLGTAVRLRIPSYFSIFACMFIVYQMKSKFSFNKIV